MFEVHHGGGGEAMFEEADVCQRHRVRQMSLQHDEPCLEDSFYSASRVSQFSVEKSTR